MCADSIVPCFLQRDERQVAASIGRKERVTADGDETTTATRYAKGNVSSTNYFYNSCESMAVSGTKLVALG